MLRSFLLRRRFHTFPSLVCYLSSFILSRPYAPSFAQLKLPPRDQLKLPRAVDPCALQESANHTPVSSFGVTEDNSPAEKATTTACVSPCFPCLLNETPSTMFKSLQCP